MINLERWQDVEKIDLKTIEENDGKLTSIEVNKDIPFEVRRIFLIHSVPSTAVIRGEHASENTEFFILTIRGKAFVKLCDGKQSFTFQLNSMTEGIYVPRMIWIEIYELSEDAIVQVCASLEYEQCKYIYNYSEFIELVNADSMQTYVENF